MVLINEYTSPGFYRKVGFEETIRNWANTFAQSYHVVIFACCRQPFSETTQRGFYKGPMEEALAKWEADCLAKELATKAAEDKTKMTEILYT